MNLGLLRCFGLYFVFSFIFAKVVEIEITTVMHGSFKTFMLDEHNKYREKHFAQPLTWNRTLEEYASQFTKKYDCSGKLTHSGGPYGENIAIGYSPTGSVFAWYNEGNDFQYGGNNVYNHFTALVWNKTSQIGCAHKYCGHIWGIYIVCSYFPAGNVVGQVPWNVFPPNPLLSSS